VRESGNDVRAAKRIDRAVRDWRRALGGAAVVTDVATRARYGIATFATDQQIAAIVRPRRAAEIPAILEIATRHRVPVHPVSRGRSYGYGCRVPVSDGAVVVDMGQLRRISRFSEELGHVTVEPGVTFRALAAYLRRRRSRRMLSMTGNPDGSVLANALERGIGDGPLGNRVEALCNLEIALPTGERVQTGFGRLPRAASSQVHRWGTGPSLDGLFSQSSFGVATSGTIWLARRPALSAGVFLEVRRARVGEMLAALRAVVEAGIVRDVIKVNNRYAVIAASYTMYPPEQIDWANIPRPYPLDGDARWRCCLTLSGEVRAELRARCKLVAAMLAGAVDQLTIDPVRSTEAESASDPDPAADSGLAALYWRHPGRIPDRLDPWRDGRGAIFCCPAVPFSPVHVRRAVALLERNFLAESFEPYITLNIMNERVVHIVAGLFYDRRAPGEDERAMRAYKNAFRACLASGYYPYRLGIQSAGELPASVDDSDAVLERIRRALDPVGVLAGSRYRPRPRSRR
jgi:4-cresol dehydrogenase (hydroxylating) flavoprotein subunit